MNTLTLDKYMDTIWEDNKDYQRLINTTRARKFQPRTRLSITANKNNNLEIICADRVRICQDVCKCSRDYYHRAYPYDNMNELERFGLGRYSRNYIVLISFEDSLDFIYSCLFKTEQNSLVDFCKRTGRDYQSYSRQHLGGGKCGNLNLTDFEGFSPSFDVVLNSIGTDDSFEKMLYFDKLFRFCEDFRNALLVHIGDSLYGNKSSILASAGVSSLVYYSDVPVNDTIEVRYKSYKTKLKLLCYSSTEYFNHLDESLCILK